MAEMTMLEKIKLLLGLTGNDKDALLNLLIDQCTEEAILYTHNEDVTDLDTSIQQMVVYNYNRLGTEGVENEGYSGVSFKYTADYPESIMRGLRAKRKVRVVQ